MIQPIRRCQGGVAYSQKRCEKDATHMVTNGAFFCDDHGINPKRRGVALLLVVNNKVLGVVRYNKNRDYNLPGGKVEVGETDWQAIIREAKEETGAVIINPIPIYCAPDNERICTVFMATWLGDMESIKGSSEGEAGWFTVEEMLQSTCTFRSFNAELFKKLGFEIPDEREAIICPKDA